MKRLFVLSLTVIVLLSIVVLPMSAGWTWCSSDPRIKLANGSVFNIKVSVPTDKIGEEVNLDIVAPAGSRVISGTGRLNIVTTLDVTGSSREIVVHVDEDFRCIGREVQEPAFRSLKFPDRGGRRRLDPGEVPGMQRFPPAYEVIFSA